MKKLGLYMLRWQLSTPILALVPIAINEVYGVVDFWTAAFISNLIGSLIFYWVDKKIFR
jgi:hypothetical protein